MEWLSQGVDAQGMRLLDRVIERQMRRVADAAGRVRRSADYLSSDRFGEWGIATSVPQAVDEYNCELAKLQAMRNLLETIAPAGTEDAFLSWWADRTEDAGLVLD